MNIKSYKHMGHIKKVYQLHEDVIIRLLDLKRIYSFKNEELHDYIERAKKRNV